MRDDIHSPKNIIPDEYQYVAEDYMKVECLGDALCLNAQRDILQAHRAQTGGKHAQVNTTGNCQVCGSVNALYTSIFYHQKSNTYVRMGHDCADKCACGGEFERNAFRRAIQDAREAYAGKRKAQAALGDAGVPAAWDIYAADYDTLPRDPKTVVNRAEKLDEFGYVVQEAYHFAGDTFYEERTIRDIVGRLVKYGSVNEAQMKLVKQLTERIPDRDLRNAEWEAKRKAEKEAAAPCPKGRIKIEGTVLKVEERETQWGFRTVMTVKATEGFVLWGSVPSNATVEKDCKIVFVATVEPSEQDAKFGYYKRPILYMSPEEKKELKRARILEKSKQINKLRETL
jgi:hypothetical protein